MQDRGSPYAEKLIVEKKQEYLRSVGESSGGELRD
jgi:hypothetical protein